MDHRKDNKKEYRCPFSKCQKFFKNPKRLSDHKRRYHINSENYVCEYCGYRTRMNSNFIVHRRQHTGEKPYCCEICGLSFVSSYQLTAHKDTHALHRKYLCNECNVSFKQKKTLLHHKLLHGKQNRYVCYICNASNCFLPINYNLDLNKSCGEVICHNIATFSIICKLCKLKIFQFDEFTDHLERIHLQEIQENCNYKEEININANENGVEEDDFDPPNYIIKRDLTLDNNKPVNKVLDKYCSSEETLQESDQAAECATTDIKYSDNEDDEDEKPRRIIETNPNPKEYKCELCDKSFSSENRLKVHTKLKHLRDRPYKCTLCLKAFAEERYLKAHSYTHTGYTCAKCSKVFTTAKGLKRHMPLHSDVKNFLCTYENCGKAFASELKLKQHFRYHTTKPFVCEECGYSCYKEESLIVHIRGHRGEKPFACNQCDRRFGSKSLLNEHMATHSTERNHICNVCGKAFNRPKALYHHKHLHLGIKKFVCKICNAAYAQAAGLSAHMRKHKQDILNGCHAKDDYPASINF
uniref:C2H2-type domain-containing protein n=1 Tax=Glossina brevipalpis TaxID=37001 RepID=A0A1A9X5Q1_9MUSC